VITDKKLAGTLDMNTNYLRPVKADGRKITVKARFVTNAKRTLHGEAVLYNSDGKVAVTASTNMMKKSE
jgi:acyl-coenzyme A thioesterase PaaI-like protein